MKFDFESIKEVAGRKVNTYLGYGLVVGAFALALIIGLICL